MIQFQEWADAIRENGRGVVTALVAVGGLVGLNYGVDEGEALVEGIAGLVVAAGGVVVGINVLISRVKAAFKRDPDIDTGPTTPGPNTSEEE